MIGERDILNFWKEIFFHQTNLQGGLEFLIPEFLNKSEEKLIFDTFGINITFKTYKSLSKATLKIKNDINKLLILPYPGKSKKSTWWLNKNFKNLYVISAIPIIFKSSSVTKLVIVSSNKPILEGEHSLLYKSSIPIKDKCLKKLIN